MAIASPGTDYMAWLESAERTVLDMPLLAATHLQLAACKLVPVWLAQGKIVSITVCSDSGVASVLMRTRQPSMACLHQRCFWLNAHRVVQ